MQHDYFSSFNQSKHCFQASSLLLLSSLLKLPITMQQKREVLWERHLKICSNSFHPDHEEVGANEARYRQKGTTQV